MSTSETLGPRIITLDTPGHKHIVLLKGGMQMGLVYWANLDTKEYRRCATYMDLFEGPWENDVRNVPNPGHARLVRHRQQANMSRIPFSTLHQHDVEAMGLEVFLPKDRHYEIGHFPVVDYTSQFPVNADPKANIRTTPLTVEGTFDEVMLAWNTPEEIRALYPDLPIRQPKPVEV